MNYLDLLSDDLMEKIVEYITYDYEFDLNKLKKKVNKLKNKIRPLEIYKSYLDEKNPKYLSIDYDYVGYGIEEYLFSNFEIKGNIVLINKCNYSYSYYGSNFISKKLNNPTYFEILIEANKSIKKTGDYHHTLFEGLNELFHTKLYEYIGILPNNNIRYFEICLSS